MKNLARRRLLQIGYPEPRNDDWIYFPTAKLSCFEIPEADGENETETFPSGIPEETDFSALLPLAYAAKTLEKVIPENAEEFGLLKTRDEFAHSVVHVRKNAKCSLEILQNIQERAYSSERLDFFVEENAELLLLILDKTPCAELHLKHLKIHARENARINIAFLNTAKGLSRTSFEIYLDGKNASANYFALHFLNGKASAHTHLKIYQNAENTKSSQFVRNILDETANASFDGSVKVKKDASEVFSSQLVNTILLSDNAKIFVKPVLEIYHDNVECTHGATCGSLDREELFYLESRGLKKEDARKILICSFIKEVFLDENLCKFRTRILKELELLAV